MCARGVAISSQSATHRRALFGPSIHCPESGLFPVATLARELHSFPVTTLGQLAFVFSHNFGAIFPHLFHSLFWRSNCFCLLSCFWRSGLTVIIVRPFFPFLVWPNYPTYLATPHARAASKFTTKNSAAALDMELQTKVLVSSLTNSPWSSDYRRDKQRIFARVSRFCPPRQLSASSSLPLPQRPKS